ncbi:MAG: ABC transporter ATP-binding protein [Sedimentisphaerales bacterium]|nr:ABC transporter ATP-binding protein [Sedimentisphaerales bacterium]
MGNNAVSEKQVVAEVQKLGKTYHVGGSDLHVLQDIDLTFERGEYLAIMGPSGSGKSTLLNLLGCLDRPSRGAYYLGGQDVSHMDDNELSAVRSERIGFVFQSYNLIAQLNVIENIEIPLFYQRVDAAESEKRARELAELVGLSHRLHHRPMQLSGGQQQRVAIARALVSKPLIILADEPTGNLDSESGAEILELLDGLQQQGTTLIVVTHDRDVAMRAHRIIHLLDGRVEKIEHNGHKENH